jgi:hypothetical protein
MPFIRRGWRLSAATLGLCLLLPATASAQDTPTRLKLPTIMAGAAAAADWASTYHAITYYELRETNPLLQPFQRSPGRLVTVGAAMDAAAFSAWNVTVGRKHPRIAAAGLWAMAGFRAYLVLHNLRNEQKVARRAR